MLFHINHILIIGQTMATYVILNIVVMLVIVAATIRRIRWNRPLLITLTILILATAIFDSIIVLTKIVAYNPSHILGLYVGAAPIEDFFYALAVVILVPTIWHIIGGANEKV